MMRAMMIVIAGLSLALTRSATKLDMVRVAHVSKQDPMRSASFLSRFAHIHPCRVAFGLVATTTTALRFAASRGGVEQQQQSSKARGRRVSPDSCSDTSGTSRATTSTSTGTSTSTTSRKKAQSTTSRRAAAAAAPPTIHLNKLLPGHLSSVISDQLADIINSHSNNISNNSQSKAVNHHQQHPSLDDGNKQHQQQDAKISSRASTSAAHHARDKAPLPVSTTFKNETTIITARCLAIANDHHGGGDDDTGAFAEEMFQRQQAIFSALSNKNNQNQTRTRTATIKTQASAAVTKTATIPAAEPMDRRTSSESSSQSLWQLLSETILEEV